MAPACGSTFDGDAEAHYSRLFDPPAQPLAANEEERLIRLGRSMRYTVEREGTLTPRVGYTYFGQFVGHDLTHDITPLAGPYLDPWQTRNHHTHYLNLEQIYGGGPTNSPQLFEGEPGAETFKVGRTNGQGYLRDLAIEKDELLVADARNIDNLILRQLHAVFLKFHNEAVKQLSSRPSTIIGFDRLGSETVFAQAQRLVRWHYQWIVYHDYLPRILHSNFWCSRLSTGREESRPKNGFCIPLEFSHAAYRFGHSMVRNAYGLNCRKRRVELPELMTMGREASPLPDDYLIEWGRFFDGLPASGPVASSSFIDTSIVAPLHNLSPQTVQLCSKTEVKEEPLNLPTRTLLRGARAKLPSGQEVAASLLRRKLLRSEECLTTDQLTSDTCDQSGTLLREAGLEHNTPLFYYLLKEADILSGGRTLGPIGSFIVARVIRGAVESDPNSYISGAGRDWDLPLWRFPSGNNRQINSVIGIIRLVGDIELLPECNEKVHKLRRNFLQADE